MRPNPSSASPIRLLLAAALAAGAGCAGTAPGTRPADDSADLREKLEAMGRDQQAYADRGEDLAERLRRAEESLAALHERVAALEGSGAPGASAIPPAGAGSSPAASPPASPAAETGADPTFDTAAAYASARDRHRERRFDEAVAAFTEILERAPDSDLADNARYWIGEARYLQRRFRPALAEFTKVLAYPYTEKADDAQLMIARSYLALGESDQAVAAFRKLLQNYPGSEYVDEAREELRQLEGP